MDTLFLSSGVPRLRAAFGLLCPTVVQGYDTAALGPIVYSVPLARDIRNCAPVSVQPSFAASAVSQTFSLHLNVMIQLSPVSGTCADPGVWSITDTRSGFQMGIYAIFRAGGRSPVQIFPPLVGQPRNLAFAFVGIESPGLLLFIMNKWSSCSQRRFRVVSEVRRGRRELRPRIEA